jgi:hypothetical protein
MTCVNVRALLMRFVVAVRAFAICALLAPFVIGCDSPNTNVVLENDYPPAATNALVVFHAFWQAVSFTTPIPPGAASDPRSTVAASPNTAYVLLAPGWDPAMSGTPTSFIVLQSRAGFEVHVNDTVHIPVDDMTFAGNCAAGSFLSQEQADFITQQVFASDFAGLSYDAATCATTGGP